MITAYLDYLRNIRRYSPRTCDIYGKILEDFIEFCSTGNNPIKDCFCVENVRNYEIHLLDKCKDSASTVRQHLSVLSSMSRFLIKEGILDSNPVHLVKKPKKEKRLPDFYRKNSMDEYFDSTDYICSEENIEVISYEKRLKRLIISILYSTGIRRAELISLTLGSVDLSRQKMTVLGKGDKMREIPLDSGLCEEISLYLRKVESTAGCRRPASEPLLVTEKGRKLYPVYIDRAVKEELGVIASITGKKSPHVLRHTLATELLNDGADLNSIKELLGHASLAATQIYTHNSVDKLVKIYNNAHPRAKRGGNYGDKD